MGKIDIIQTIFDSYELFKAHYREVAIPLIFLLIVSGAGSFGRSSLGDFPSGSDDRSWREDSQTASSLIANAMEPLDAFMGLGLLAIVAILLITVAIAILVAVLRGATEFYVFEHFYSILLGRKITEDWQQRLLRHSFKVIAIQVFWLFLTLLMFAVPIYLSYTLVLWVGAANIDIDAGLAEVLMKLLEHFAPALLAFIAAFLILFIIGFLLSALWIYYSMDRNGFFDSLGKSVSLVSRNLLEFAIAGIIFWLLSFATLGVSLACCCFAWIIAPLAEVFLTVLYGITMMKMKLALEKK